MPHVHAKASARAAIRLSNLSEEILLHPHPCTRDDVGEIALRRPFQQGSSHLRIGQQNGRVARPARSHLVSNRSSSSLLHGADDFENGISSPASQIERNRIPAAFQM